MWRIKNQYIVTIILLCAGFLYFCKAYKIEFVDKTSGSGTIKKLQGNFNVSTANSPMEAKEKGLFWIDDETPGGQGGAGALSLVENETVYESLFPGYSKEMLSDKNLWKRYFRREFSQHSWFSTQTNTIFQVSASGFGCLDVYEQNGADVIILGSSETYHSLAPRILYEKFSTGALAGSRILNCTMGSEVIPTMTSILGSMQTMKRPKAKWIVLGLSSWLGWADCPGFYEIIREQKLYAPSVLSTLSKGSIRKAFPGISWAFLNRANDSSGGLEIQSKMAGALDLSSEEAAKKYVRKFIQGYNILHGIGPAACDMNKFSQTIDELIFSMQNVSEKILIFIPPIIPEHVSAYPACFMPNLIATLKKKESDRVHFLNLDFDGFGMQYRDYIYSNGSINAPHPKYSGALRISNLVADQLLKLTVKKQ